jgi:hypothetical protein
MLDKKYPKLWAYLKANEKALRAREKGRYNVGGEEWRWYDLARPQSIDETMQPFVAVQSLSRTSKFALANQGIQIQHGSTGGGIYGISLTNPELAQLFLAILNSKVLDFANRQVTTSFAGGYISYTDAFLKNLPIPDLERNDMSILKGHSQQLIVLSSECSAIQRKLERFPESVTESLREHKKTPDLESFTNLASGHSPFNSDLRHHKDTRIETDLMGETVLLIPKGKTGHTEIRGKPSFLAIVRATLEQRKKISRNDLLALPIPERENVQREYIQTLQHWKNDLERLQNEIETLETELNDAVYLAFDLDAKERAVIESFLERF